MGARGLEAVCGKIFPTMLLHLLIPFNLIMQHDHVLKKLNFDLFDPILRVGGEGGRGGLRTKYLLPCCCIRDSL